MKNNKHSGFFNKSLSSKFFFIFWLGTLVIFFILTYLFNVFYQNFQENPDSPFQSVFLILYILNIFSGIASFIFGLITYFSEKIHKGNRLKKQLTQSLKNEKIQESKVEMLKKVKRFLYFWIGSIILFCLLVFAVNGDFSTAPSIYGILLIVDILIGVIFFLILFCLVIKNRFWDWLAITIFIFISFFIILLMLPNRNNNQISTGDPYVDCPINEKCGGGTKRLRQSECINSTCCQVGDVWVVLDKDQCKLKQQEYSKNNKPVYLPPPQIKIPEIEPPICCRQTCSPFTGVCTTKCEKSYACF